MDLQEHEPFMKRCYELAIQAGKKGYDTFGAVMVSGNEIIAEAENTSDYSQGLFGHAEFNLVHQLANQYSDHLLSEAVLYTSTAPCTRCLLAIASLGINKIVYGVSYESFNLLLPFEPEVMNYESALKSIQVDMVMVGPVLEQEGMRTYEYWGGNYRPLEELLEESSAMRKKGNNCPL
jgi:tRNA(Arg) A34 adenosine deaminase TadA